MQVTSPTRSQKLPADDGFHDDGFHAGPACDQRDIRHSFDQGERILNTMVFHLREESIRFREEQRFYQLWVWIIIAFITVLAWYFFVVQLIFGEQLGNNPAPDWVVLIIWLIFGIIFPLWFILMKLEIVVTDSGLSFRFFPMHPKWRTIPFPDIVTAEAVTYHPLREFGGWGIRFGWHGGMAYNVRGDRGVRITLNNGKKILLGSQHAEELAQALQSGLTQVHRKEHTD